MLINQVKSWFYWKRELINLDFTGRENWYISYCLGRIKMVEFLVCYWICSSSIILRRILSSQEGYFIESMALILAQFWPKDIHIIAISTRIPSLDQSFSGVFIRIIVRYFCTLYRINSVSLANMWEPHYLKQSYFLMFFLYYITRCNFCSLKVLTWN